MGATCGSALDIIALQVIVALKVVVVVVVVVIVVYTPCWSHWGWGRVPEIVIVWKVHNISIAIQTNANRVE